MTEIVCLDCIDNIAEHALCTKCMQRIINNAHALGEIKALEGQLRLIDYCLQYGIHYPLESDKDVIEKRLGELRTSASPQEELK